jgi:hypothetical protein
MILAAISGESLLWVLIWIVIAGVLFWLGNWFLAYVGVPAPFDKVAKVVLAIIAFVFLINALMTLAGKPFIAW